MQNVLSPHARVFPRAAALGFRNLRPGDPPLKRLALAFAFIYLFIILSRTFDVTLSALRIPMAFFVLATLLAMVAGNVFQILRSKVGLAMVAMILWLGVATVFSTWPGGSITTLQLSFQSFAFAVAIIAIGTTTSDTMRFMHTIAYASLAAALLSFFAGKLVEGRIALYQGTYGDPNQYAMGLLIGLPFWLFVARTGSRLKKAAACAAIILIFGVFLRTGSRGGAIGLLAIVAVFFLRASAVRKLLIIAAAVATIIGAVAFLPRYITARYFTFFEAQSSQLEELSERERALLAGADTGSATGRLQLLKESLVMTLQNPVFGVGPGQFVRVRWEHYFGRGVNSGIFVTHNAYTEISSETGIPGFLIFLSLVVFTFQTIFKTMGVRKMPGYKIPQHIVDAGAYFTMSALALGVCSFFLSVGYSQLFYIFGALAAVYHRSVMNELPSWRVAGAPAPAATIMAR